MLLQPPTCLETDARAGGDRTGNKRPPQPNPARKALTAEHLRPQSPQDASRPDAGTLTAFFRKRMSPDRWKALRSPPRIRIELKLQYFGHLMLRGLTGKDSDAGRDWGQEETERPGMLQSMG